MDIRAQRERDCTIVVEKCMYILHLAVLKGCWWWQRGESPPMEVLTSKTVTASSLMTDDSALEQG